MAKIIEMPKPKINQREFDDMFKGFITQVDSRQGQLATKGHVGEDGGWIPEEEK